MAGWSMNDRESFTRPRGEGEFHTPGGEGEFHTPGAAGEFHTPQRRGRVSHARRTGRVSHARSSRIPPSLGHVSETAQLTSCELQERSINTESDSQPSRSLTQETGHKEAAA